MRIDLRMIEENHLSARGISQARTERMLERWATELGVRVRRGYEVVGLSQTADGVMVAFDGPGGRGEDSAMYLVGCDGARSTVRMLAGIDFPGAEPTRGFYMADVTGIDTRRRRIGEHVPGGSMVMAMDLENGVTRIVVHEKGMTPRDKDTCTFTELADAWQRLTGESIHHAQVHWLSTFTDAARVATQYRRGRVFLVGDATHVQVPAMAQGLSAGVQDAANLGWKLAAAINGWAPAGLLDTYHVERHPIGHQLVRNAQASVLLRLTGGEMDPLRGVLAELVACKDAAGYLAGMVSGLGVRYDMGPGQHPLLGRRMPPERELNLPDGTRTRIADLLHQARGLFISTTAPSAAAHLAAGWADRIDIVTGNWVPPTAPATQPVPQEALIRPDGYIAWAAPGGGDLSDALSRWFGSARTAATAQPAAASTRARRR
jgi:2-polyprenyl-6-methoxyphenol hydroxylase-like FAD-dependent oxidoreductase